MSSVTSAVTELTVMHRRLGILWASKRTNEDMVHSLTELTNYSQRPITGYD